MELNGFLHLDIFKLNLKYFDIFDIFFPPASEANADFLLLRTYPYVSFIISKTIFNLEELGTLRALCQV